MRASSGVLLLNALRALRTSARGAALVEFAILLPFLLTLLTVSLELSRWMRARQHLEDYANMVAYDIAGVTGVVSPNTLHEMIQRIGLVAPELINPAQAAWNTGLAGSNTSPTNYLGVGISMLVITPTVSGCQSNCAYTSQLAWTFGANPRHCPEEATPDPVLPLGFDQQPGPVVVVDVTSTYNFIYGASNTLAGFARGGGRSTIATSPTLSTTTFQPVRNWRGSSVNPPLGVDSISGLPTAGNSAVGQWVGHACNGFT